MKKFLLSATLLVVFSLTSFAAEKGVNNGINAKIESEFTSIDTLKYAINFEVDGNCTIFTKYNLGDEIKILADFKECHVKIEGTINGKPINLDITFTSDSGSCLQDTIKLLKEIAAAN
jgi:hypothetical protein